MRALSLLVVSALVLASCGSSDGRSSPPSGTGDSHSASRSNPAPGLKGQANSPTAGCALSPEDVSRLLGIELKYGQRWSQRIGDRTAGVCAYDNMNRTSRPTGKEVRLPYVQIAHVDFGPVSHESLPTADPTAGRGGYFDATKPGGASGTCTPASGSGYLLLAILEGTARPLSSARVKATLEEFCDAY
jgi:hypothetical protein